MKKFKIEIEYVTTKIINVHAPDQETAQAIARGLTISEDSKVIKTEVI